MRGLVAFLFFCLAVASASPAGKAADSSFLTKQKEIYELLYHVHQPNTHTDQVDLGRSYSIEAHKDKYEPKVVDRFMRIYKAGMLPKDMTFSTFYPKLMQEAKALFELLYTAKDWDTFYKTACWAREHVNEEMFVYTLSVALIHRDDCEGMMLPPPYEIVPHYFFPAEVIDKAYKVKMQEHGKHIASSVHEEDKDVVIVSNFTDWNVHYNREERLTYFTEDIGLSSYYYYNYLDYPVWMEGDKYGLKKDGRGEIYYYLHQQLLARYYLERLSNGLGEIPEFSWRWPISTGYHPNLKYDNGMDFPDRPNYFDLSHEKFLKDLIHVEDFERRVRDTIDRGYATTTDGSKINITNPEGIEVLASIMQSNADVPNPKLYKYSVTVAKRLLGNSPTPISWHKVLPSVMGHYKTCVRDPMFWQMYKRYVRLFQEYKKILHPYTKEDLACPGVKIENVEVGKLVTYFDHHDVEITNAVYQTMEESKKKEDNNIIKVRQTRLNHLPFTVTTNVVSEKSKKVVVRIFLGPKYNGKGDLMRMSENRENFFEMDQFVYELKSGKNTIQRNSRSFWYTIPDWPASRQQYKDMSSALSGGKQFMLNNDYEHNCFPDRLLLPKGRKGGMPFYVYVIISPYVEPKVPYGTGYDEVISSGIGTGGVHLDGLALGYPFDKPTESESDYYLTNMHLEDVLIFHKKETDINQATHD